MTIIELSRKLISLDTCNPPGNEQLCSELIGKLLEDAGYEVRYSEFANSRKSLVATLGRNLRNTSLCFTGHLDTVRLGSQPWNYSPFDGEIEGDLLFGRGSTDMKCGVAAMITTALKLAKKSDLKNPYTFVFTAGEETCCQGAYHLCKSQILPESVGAIIVGEPTENSALLGHKGVVRFNVRVRGKSAHGAMPHLGINAIHKLSEIIAILRDYKPSATPHDILGMSTINIGTISGGSSINVVPDEAVLGVEVRTIPGQTKDIVIQEVSTLFGNDVEIEFLESADFVLSSEKNSWIEDTFEVAKKYSGGRGDSKIASFFTDASVLSSYYGNCPTVILGPGQPSKMHQVDESCSITKIEEVVEIYEELAMRWNDKKFQL